MSNLDDRGYSNREVNQRREVTQSSNGNYPNKVTTTSETVTSRENPLPSNVAYGDGYTQGRLSQQRIYEENQAIRDNENAGRGLLLGILVTALAALALGSIFLLNQRSQAPTVIQRVVPKVSPSPSPSPQVRERIIEHDRVVPVPQSPPEVNIAVPNAGQQAPATQSAPVAPETQPNSSTGSSQSSTGSSSSQSPTGSSQVSPSGNGSNSTGANQ
jgi:hypothetical protein